MRIVPASSGRLIGTISTYPGTYKCPLSRVMAQNPSGEFFYCLRYTCVYIYIYIYSSHVLSIPSTSHGRTGGTDGDGRPDGRTGRTGDGRTDGPKRRGPHKRDRRHRRHRRATDFFYDNNYIIHTYTYRNMIEQYCNKNLFFHVFFFPSGRHSL